MPSRALLLLNPPGRRGEEAAAEARSPAEAPVEALRAPELEGVFV